jgi:hypothetical protein
MDASVCHEPGLPLGETDESPQATAAKARAPQREPIRFIRQMYTRGSVVLSSAQILSKNQRFAFCSPMGYPLSAGRTVTIYVWPDRRPSRTPRAVLQRGRCGQGQCAPFSISISNGETGMTVRFDSEQEFRLFLEHDTLTADEESGTTPSARGPDPAGC